MTKKVKKERLSKSTKKVSAVTKTSEPKKIKEAGEKEILEGIAKQLLLLLGVKSLPLVSEDKENDALVVDIKGEEESGLLIGARGRTLESLQILLGLLFRQKVGVWKRVIVNVSDWREKEEERLKELAEQTAERALSSGSPQYLYNLTPSQRRLVHMTLSTNNKIKTESQGEGTNRFLIVSPQ